MKERVKIIIGICALADFLTVGLICLFTIYGKDSSFSSFDGSEVRNSDEFILDFTYMDKNDSHTVRLLSGDILTVNYEIESGRTDVAVGISGQKPIYRGNDIETASFELPIVETGDYIISVNAAEASGKIEFAAVREHDG